jgi:peroxiredoxin
MAELGQLEKHHAEFDKRHVKVVVISNDDQETARATQDERPHLVVVSDKDQSMAKAFEVIQTGMGPSGSDTNAPTTFLVDETGTVRWHFRPDRFVVRLSPEEVLAAVDANLKKE